MVDGRRRFRQRGKNAAGVQPARADFPEDVIPVEIAGLQLCRRRVATIRHTDRAPDAEATLGEIQAIAHAAADAVVFAPLDEVRVHAALHDEILDEMTDLVVHECGTDGGFAAETFAQAARGVVFATAFPRGERARGADAAFARIKSEHDFAERDLVVFTGGFVA